ncbi:probable serine/threonine-protein kinase roco5 [Nylanderia fulva]|uniref:probable serine/threonine-protein kinase roco5 n=1 Tax=Nylanderia fulva TaxID=613905 RepID=UPI0010FB360A|nr:probable serine/threonine-protein kinase roco5 [Nylanderia fulva]
MMHNDPFVNHSQHTSSHCPITQTTLQNTINAEINKSQNLEVIKVSKVNKTDNDLDRNKMMHNDPFVNHSQHTSSHCPITQTRLQNTISAEINKSQNLEVSKVDKINDDLDSNKKHNDPSVNHSLYNKSHLFINVKMNDPQNSNKKTKVHVEVNESDSRLDKNNLTIEMNHNDDPSVKREPFTRHPITQIESQSTNAEINKSQNSKISKVSEIDVFDCDLDIDELIKMEMMKFNMVNHEPFISCSHSITRIEPKGAISDEINKSQNLEISGVSETDRSDSNLDISKLKVQVKYNLSVNSPPFIPRIPKTPIGLHLATSKSMVQAKDTESPFKKNKMQEYRNMSRNHKDKYENSNPRRMYTLMCSEDYQSGKKSHWSELEITGSIRNLSPNLWQMSHLTALYLNDNSLQRVPPEIGRLANLRILDLSSNKLRSLPAELGDLIYLRELLLNQNYLRVLPYELGKLFQLQVLGLQGNPLSKDVLTLYGNGEPAGTNKLLTYMLDNLTGK